MIKYSRKGGRPPKDLGQKKTYRINLKLITEEYYLLKSKVKIAKTTISEFVRSCLKNGYVKERVSVEQVEHIRKLSGMANNLNQIARQANIQDFHSMQNECVSIANRIDNVIKQLEE